MFTCIICGRKQPNAYMSRKNRGMCKSCKRKKLKSIATAAEMVYIYGGFTKTPLKTLRRIYKSLEVANVDRLTFISMVFMYAQPRINLEMQRSYALPEI